MQLANFKLFPLHFALVLLITLGAAPTQKNPRAAKVSVTTHLDRTALWVGDTLNYRIQAIYDRDVELVVENLRQENLSLAPFVVRGMTVQHSEWGQSKKLLHVTLLLSTYDTGKTELTIPSFNLYYFVREAGLGKKDSPAEAIQVPAIKVGLRSTLVGGPLKPRDSKPIGVPNLSRGWMALFLGLAGMVFLAGRSVRWAWIALHRERPIRKRLSQREQDRLVQESLARIQLIGRESPENIFQFYTELSQFLRQYLTQSLEIDALSLTPEEIERAVEKTGSGAFSAGQIRTILEQCDAVRYGKDGLRIGRENQTGLLEAVKKVVTSAKI